MASTHQCSISFNSDDFTPDDHIVAQILNELSLLIQISDFSLGLPPSWPIRRKRSAVVSPPDCSSVVAQPPPPPSSSEGVKESSPTTPFSLNSLPLSRSESDENIAIVKVSKKKASLDKKFQYYETIDKLIHQNQALVEDVEAMKQRFAHLKTINSELKATKQEVSMILGGSTNQSEIPEIGTSSSGTKSSYSNVEKNLHECEPSTKNQTAPMAEQSNNNQNYQIPIVKVPLHDPSLDPMGIPDLNLTVEQNFQMNYTKYLAANARQNRIRICKNKKNNSNGPAN